MDLLRLETNSPVGKIGQSIGLIEGYSSLIWTERFQSFGEFELKTALVNPTLDALPIGSLVSHTDTKEIMIVETAEIAKGQDDYPELTMRGRSLHSLLEVRLIDAPWPEKFVMRKNYSHLDAALIYIWNSLVNDGNFDVTFYAIDLIAAKGLDRKIPNSVVTDSTPPKVLTAERQWVQAGPAWPIIRSMLINANCGIRTIRPNSGTSIQTMEFNIDVIDNLSKGNVHRTFIPSFTEIRFDVYQGTNRSQNQKQNPPVIFKVLGGHVDNPSYLFSMKDHRTSVYVRTPYGSVEVFPVTIEPSDTGLNCRHLYIDGGAPAEGQSPDDFMADIPRLGRAALSEHARTYLFDGQISSMNPYTFNKDYFLGDQVTVMAEYGFQQTMVVDEYVRTEDQTGDRGTPGLRLLT